MFLGALIVGLLVGGLAGLVVHLWLAPGLWGALLIGVVAANVGALVVLWWRARRR